MFFEKLKQAYEYIANVFCDVPVSVQQTYREELGCTTRTQEKAYIWLNPTHELVEKNKKPELFMYGILGHELMHLLMTDFDATTDFCTAKSVTYTYLFHNIFNIIEDSRIENFAYLFIGGNLLKALKYSINQIWEQSPNIDESENDMSQILNALIQYGDIGKIKGEFNTDETMQTFNKITDIFDEAIKCKKCRDVLPYCYDIYQILVDSFGSSSINISKPLSNHSEGGSSNIECNGEAKDDKKEEKSKTKKSLSMPIEKKDSSDESDGDIKDESAEKSSDVEDGDSDNEGESKNAYNKNADEDEKSHDSKSLSDEEADSIIDELKAKAESIEKEEKKSSESGDKSIDFDKKIKLNDDYNQCIVNIKPSIINEEKYEKLLKKFSLQINSLASSIINICKNEKGGNKKALRGKVNVKTYYSPVVTPLIFTGKEKNVEKSFSIMVLVDESGSMESYSRSVKAQHIAVIIAEAMAKAEIPCKIVGYTADEGCVGNVNLRHYTSFKNTMAERKTLIGIRGRCENRDGATVEYCSKILESENTKNKLLLILTDGIPCANNYYGEDAINDTKAHIRKAKKRHDLFAVSIDSPEEDVLKEMYGDDFGIIHSETEFIALINKVLKNTFKRWTK